MQKFSTPAPISAVLDVPAGRVQLIAADRTDTTVDVRPANASNNSDVKAAAQARVSYNDGVLLIDTPASKRILGNPGSIEVTVQLPAGSGVKATSASADFRTVGRLGDVAFDGARASIKLDEAASVRLTALDGDVVVGRLGGAAEVRTARGDIKIVEAVRGTVVLRTEAGSISVGAAAGVSASLDAGTAHGRIHNALMNPGGAADLSIHATTSYGDITARSL